jgi:hypothetical protein
MELTADLDAPCTPEVLFRWVDDLDRYPEWLGIVRRTERDGDASVAASWTVDLQAQMGPLSRAKRLRMQRTSHDHPRLAVFERRELDDRHHGSWVLRAEVSPTASGSHLAMSLRYDGRLWGPAVAAVLHQEIERSRARLLDLVAT